MLEIITSILTNTTPLEWAANIATAVCIFLAGRNNVHTWWTGIIACILFMFLFYERKLYADAKLQVFFIITGIIGWYGWVKTPNKPALPVTHSSWADQTSTILVTLIAYLGYTLVLVNQTDAAAPVWDSAILFLSINAQLLMMGRKVESWPLWLIVNTIAVPLFASRGLFLTSFMYSLFWLNAAYSWWYWTQLARKATQSKVLNALQAKEAK